MNTAQLKSFLAVVETNSFSEAAYSLYLSQSNVSKHIIALEKEFGLKLLNRHGRNICLTEFGQYFKKEAEAILASYSKIKEKATQLQDLQTKTIRVVTIPILYNSAFNSLFETFKTTYSDVKLHLREKEPGEVIVNMRNGDYAYGIVRDFYGDISELDAIPIVKTHLSAIVPKGHRLAERKIISLSELKDEKFISVYEESRIPAYIIKCCQSVGFTPNIELSLRRIANVYDYVGNGKGVSLMLYHSIENPDLNYKNVVKLELEEKFESKVLLVRNKDYEVCEASKKLEDFLSSVYDAY